MKTISSFVAGACLFLFTSTLQAQETAFASNAFNIPGSVSNDYIDVIPDEINEKVATDFSKRFSDATKVIWSANGKSTSVYFEQKEIPTRVIYKNGKLDMTIKFFHGVNVPASVNNLMARNGFVATVTDVTEIKGRYTTSMFVMMEDAKYHTTVQVHPDGELSVYEQYQKQIR